MVVFKTEAEDKIEREREHQSLNVYPSVSVDRALCQQVPSYRIDQHQRASSKIKQQSLLEPNRNSCRPIHLSFRICDNCFQQ